MNNQRRKQLKGAAILIRQAYDIIEEVCNEEEEALENYPENLQDSDKYYAGEEAVETLQEQLSTLEDVCDAIEEL